MEWYTTRSLFAWFNWILFILFPVEWNAVLNNFHLSHDRLINETLIVLYQFFIEILNNACLYRPAPPQQPGYWLCACLCSVMITFANSLDPDILRYWHEIKKKKKKKIEKKIEKKKSEGKKTTCRITWHAKSLILHKSILQPNTVKPVLSPHSEIDKTKILKPYGTLMQVKSTTECWEHSAILLTCIKLYWSWKPFFCLLWVAT